MSDSHVLHPRWLPLLKIEISSNGQKLLILSQNVPKFELYQDNQELGPTDTILEEDHPMTILSKFGSN
jgi:hypothetical protein